MIVMVKIINIELGSCAAFVFTKLHKEHRTMNFLKTKKWQVTLHLMVRDLR